MGYTKYNLTQLYDKENDIKRITGNIDYIFDEFKEINKYIDSDIKLRNNIHEQFNDLIKNLENLLERLYNTSQIIDKAISEYSNGEQQINILFNQLIDTDTKSHDYYTNITQSNITNINDINILQEWFTGLRANKIDHVKSFLDRKKIRINNGNYSNTENNYKENNYMKLDDLVTSQNKLKYDKQDRIKQIQQYINNKGINLEVTGKLDRATLQASRMTGIDELIDNAFIRKNSFMDDGLNLHTHLQNSSFTYLYSNEKEPYDVGPEGSIEDRFDLFDLLDLFDSFDSIDLSDIKDTRDLARRLIANPRNIFITQNPYLVLLFKRPIINIFNIFGFFMDNNKVYHTLPDCWQRFFGYNDFYDAVFDSATSMKKTKFEFSSGGRDYIFWAWKGDYLNLGAGAELGIYSRESNIPILGNITTPHDGHWLVDTDLAMPMTLTLKHKGETIISYDPSKDEVNTYEKVWWITGFNPYKPGVQASDLTATYTINFKDNETMFYDFAAEYDGIDKRWVFDYENLSATLNF
ncbi:hypothetical protein SH1V18_20820 [Vallitalea longa]|uniref:DUF4474 domain-containing protein n=1 Tax=Vallitalea longa TaxID=2936439 RepID=A0A9W5Y993_9FIRM|nr:DUF4474 domain-containing protein [Vallitalea longa]GKX29602.1 hypothetical protein SH1V18_20820 [Vallitalea longa]